MRLYLAVGLFAGIITDLVGHTAALIGGIAAIVTGAGYLWRNVLLPFAHLVRRALDSYEALENIAEALQKIGDVGTRLDHIESRLDRLEAQADNTAVLAAAAREPAEALARELGVQHRTAPR